MLFLYIIQDYLLWHYTRAFNEIFHVWLNFIWFTIHFFSLPLLLRSWFAPWKRMTEDRGDTWSLEDFASYIIINILSRLFGFIARGLIIIIGLIALLLTSITGFLIYLLWAVAPTLLIIILGFGISLLFSSLIIYL